MCSSLRSEITGENAEIIMLLEGNSETPTAEKISKKLADVDEKGSIGAVSMAAWSKNHMRLEHLKADLS